MNYFDEERFGAEYAAVIATNVGKLDQAIAAGFRPPPRLSVSEWAAAHRKFPDDAPYPGDWKNSVAPELVEIMDALDPRNPCEEVALKKCAQSGGSAGAENFIGYCADLHPGPMIFVQATAPAAKNWAKEKFWPMVESSPRLDPSRGGCIAPLGEKDGSGSNQKLIKFAGSGGYTLLCGANSAADLRQRTVRYAVEDDLDQFPDDLDNQGSPESMVDARLRVFRSRGLSKRLKISTPTVKGASKIDTAFHASDDRRRFYLKCCHCGDRFRPEWSDIQWPSDEPEKAALQAPCCGASIPHWRKPELKLPDGWLSEVIDGEKTPKTLSEAVFQSLRQLMPKARKIGFHLPGVISTFLSWAEMAVDFLDAQGDENMLKAWTNLVLGDVYEIKGGRPDHERLKALREQEWGAGDVPDGVVATTLGVDVQADGVYLELVGWGRNFESWQLDARFLPGDTDVAGQGAWSSLDDYSRRGVTFPGGQTLPIDQECVDAGYHTEAARAYCELSSRRTPVFGRAGWTLPVLGRGEAIDYGKRGKRAGKASVREEDRAYIVGTFSIKLSWYGFLRESLKWHQSESDDTTPPKGLVHVGRDVPEDWFEQVTAEVVAERKVGLTKRREWQVLPGRQNHYLDCRVYNRAAAEKLLLDRLSEADWTRLHTERHGEPSPAPSATDNSNAKETSSTPDGAANWIDPGDNYWQ